LNEKGKATVTFSFLDKKKIDDLNILLTKMSDWFQIFSVIRIKNMDIILDLDDQIE